MSITASKPRDHCIAFCRRCGRSCLGMVTGTSRSGCLSQLIMAVWQLRVPAGNPLRDARKPDFPAAICPKSSYLPVSTPQISSQCWG